MRDYKQEYDSRVAFIKKIVQEAGVKGIVFGNSGGKDSALVGILCKAACENTLGVIMPCGSKRNYNLDKNDAMLVANAFNIDSKTVDLADVQAKLIEELACADLNATAKNNIAPRLRMTTLYTVAAQNNMLVAGTGNRSEAYMGYFTKWGDGAYDFNPISDLTVTEIFEFLRYLNAPKEIIEKAPSAALFEGQTDEQEMGVTYAEIDEFLYTGKATEKSLAIINSYHSKSEHKRNSAPVYKNV